MRKVVLTLAAAGALLFVGAHGFQADATVGSGTHALPMPAKDDFAYRSSRLQVRRTDLPDRLHAGMPAVEVLVRALPLTAQ
jgi:hypothetical protein